MRERRETRSLRVRPLAAGLWMLVATGVAAAAIWLTTAWLLGVADDAPAGAQRVTIRVDAVRTGLAAGGGAGAAVGLLLAFRRQRHQEIATALNQLDVAERRVTELYNAAAEQLGSDKAPVRLTALYTLERLANDNPAQRQTIVNIVCAYLRMPHAGSPTTSAADRDAAYRAHVRQNAARYRSTRGGRPAPADQAAADPREEEQVRQTAQRLLGTHLHADAAARWEGLSLDLTGAVLHDFSLADCAVVDATFRDAILVGRCTFAAAAFTGAADFTRVTFTQESAFARTVFTGSATFAQAVFTGSVDFEEAVFAGGARFSGAKFSDWAHLEQSGKYAGPADFKGAVFGGDTDFVQARFVRHADFAGARFARVSFDQARFDMPAGFGRAGFTGDAGFGQARFAAEAGFDRATFAGRTDLTQAAFAEEVSFDQATFSGPLRVLQATFAGPAGFEHTTFAGLVDFTQTEFQRGVGLGNALLTDRNLPHCLPDGWRIEPAEGTTGRPAAAG